MLDGALVVLLTALTLGLVRALRGPTSEDRILAVQLLGSGGVGLVLLLGERLQLPALADVALVMALLAAVSVVVVTRREPEQ